ncbi:MAG: hypothetical protein R3A10_02020 [Caldilineaceae bacterium]
MLALDGLGGGMRGLLAALAKLICNGVPCAPVQLFAARAVTRVDLDNLAATTAPLPHSPTTMLTNGATIRRPDDVPSQPLPVASLREFVKGHAVGDGQSLRRMAPMIMSTRVRTPRRR